MNPLSGFNCDSVFGCQPPLACGANQVKAYWSSIWAALGRDNSLIGDSSSSNAATESSQSASFQQLSSELGAVFSRAPEPPFRVPCATACHIHTLTIGLFGEFDIP